MIAWRRDISHEEILNRNENEITIDFANKIAFSSSEISTLLIVVKKCIEKNKTLVFKLNNPRAREILDEFGFGQLGVQFISKD